MSKVTWQKVIKEKTRPDPAFVLNVAKVREYPKCSKSV